ncbi:MAG: hypothetical protein KIS92_25125 [Planctomycetota bacterium]|nr:hypothetical protein [Planctomycetota bacterium]
MARKSSEGSGGGGIAPAQVLQAWAKGRLPGMALICGQETALREEAIANLRKAAFRDGDGGMAWVVLHGPRPGSGDAEPLTPAAVLDEVRTRPMFGDPDDPKVVLVRQAEGFFANADFRDVFERNLGEMPENACLALEIADPGRLKSTNFYKKVAAAGGLVACEPLRDQWGNDQAGSPLVEELERRAKALGLNLTPRAAVALIERSGHTLGVLEEELAKLALTLGAGGGKAVTVDEGQIEAICADTRLVGAFEFADAVAERNLKGAWEALGAVFAKGLGDHKKPGRVVSNESEIAMRLLGALTFAITQLQDVRALIDAGRSEFDACKEAKLFGFRADKARRQLRKHTAQSLRACVEALFRANLDMRTGTDRQAALEKMIVEMCRA